MADVFTYVATHVSVYDGSDAMMVSENPFLLVNEDGYPWADDPEDWRAV